MLVPREEELTEPGSSATGFRAVTNRFLVRGALLPFAVAAVVLWWFFAGNQARADVGPAGSFTTAVQVQAPSFHGLQPGLSLRYSSQTGNGWTGVGWALAGTSVIERQSGLHGLPTWGAGDHYALDGTNLLPCAGGTARVAASPSCAHQVAGTAGYAGQVENYERIAFTPDTSGGSWTVWRTDGVTVVYQPVTVTGKGVLDWRVSTVRDLSGNTVSYHWAVEAGDEPELGSISYGDVVITFKTGQRSDDGMTVADGDGLLSVNDQLSEIDETAASKPVRSYRLTYEVHDGKTRESFLHSVREYGSDGTAAYPATVYDTSPPGQDVSAWQAPLSPRLTGLVTGWPSGVADGNRWDQSLGGPGQGSLTWPNQGDDVTWLTADINRDQRTDIIEIRPQGPSGLEVETERNSDNGGYLEFGSQLQFNWPVPFTGAKIWLGDVNGDGYPDLVVSAHGYVGVALNLTLTGADSQFAVAGVAPTALTGTVVAVADVTGDGKADLVALDPPASGCGGAASLQSFIGDGTGRFTSVLPACLPAVTAGLKLLNPFAAVDLNNDLKADLATYIDAGSSPASAKPQSAPDTSLIVTAVSTGGGHFQVLADPTGQDWPAYAPVVFSARCPQDPPEGPPYGDRCAASAEQPAVWGDFDGDHRTDLAVLTAGPKGTEVANVLTSLGDGTFAPPQAWPTPLAADALTRYENVPVGGTAPGVEAGEVARAPDEVLTGDFDGDGQTDLAVLSTTADGTAYTSVERLLNSENDGFLAGTPIPVSWRVTDCADAPAPTCSRPLVTTGDVNGDGRDDITGIGGTVGGAAVTGTEVTPAGPQLSGLLSGDVNGDGISDEVSVAMASDTAVEVRTYLGAGNDRFTRVAPVTVDVGGAGIKHLPAGGWRLADVTGDHQADLVNLPPGARYGVLLAATSTHGWTAHLISLTGLDHTVTVPPAGGGVTCEPKQPGEPLHCHPVSPGPPATVTEPAVLPRTGEWQVADVTGDGIPDLVHAGPGPWGTPGVLVLAGAASGTLATEWTPAPDAATSAALANPLGWHLADVNGDGSADLVDADTAHGAVHTLLRRGTSWLAVQQAFGTSTSAPCLHPPGSCTSRSPVLVEAGGADDGAWQPSDVNGDGDQDLVRVVAAPSPLPGLQEQLYVEELISLGNGGWQPGPVTALPAAKTADVLANADEEDWRPTDFDLDGRGDLVKATQSGGLLHVQVLLSDGPGGWTLSQSTATVPAGTADDWAVQSDDGTITLTHLSNAAGDYRQEQVSSALAPDVITTTSNGLGASTEVSYSPAAAFTTADTPAAQCRLPQGTAPFVVTSLTTSVLEPGLVPASAGASGASGQPAVYEVQVGDTLGSISEARLGDASRWPQIWALNDNRAEPGGVSFTNPADLQPGWSLTIPAQSPPGTALRVTPAQAVTDTSTFRYGCSSYSAPLRSFLGWTDTWTTHAAAVNPVTGAAGRPASVEHVTRAIDDASGIQQVTLDETTTADGTPLHRTITGYEPVGDSPPYVSLTARTDTGDCAGISCADSSTLLSYDADGNVTSETGTAAGSGLQRTTTTSYLYNDTAWLHHQPRLSETSAVRGGTSTMLRATMTCYDDDTSSTCNPPQPPPAARGLVLAVRQFTGSTFLTTHTYQYDSFGNQVAATDANGNTTTTTYDSAGLFPVSTCNALKQCTNSTDWDRTAEAPEQTTAITGGQTTTQYDPLGRPVRSVGPTGIITTTSYAFTATGTTTVTTETAGALSRWTQSDTDGLGRVVRTETPGSGNQHPIALETDTLYLDATLTAATTAPHYAGQDAPDWTATSYDALGRPAATRHADGSAAPASYGMSAGYDTAQTADEDGRNVTIRYTDGWNNLAKVVQELRRGPGPADSCHLHRRRPRRADQRHRPARQHRNHDLEHARPEDWRQRPRPRRHDLPRRPGRESHPNAGRPRPRHHHAVRRPQPADRQHRHRHRPAQNLDLRHRHRPGRRPAHQRNRPLRRRMPRPGFPPADLQPARRRHPADPVHQRPDRRHQYQLRRARRAGVHHVPRQAHRHPDLRPRRPPRRHPGLRTGHQLQRRRTARQYHLRQPHHRCRQLRPGPRLAHRAKRHQHHHQRSRLRRDLHLQRSRDDRRHEQHQHPGARLHLQHARRTHQRHRCGHRPEHADPHLRRPRQHRNQQQYRYLYLPR